MIITYLESTILIAAARGTTSLMIILYSSRTKG